MTGRGIELLPDADREGGWWLLVDGSEQSYVDLSEPLHLEFEYVQMIAHVLDIAFPSSAPLRALHLGGGLCTVPRWLAARHPGSRQVVAEHNQRIARLAQRLGLPPGVQIVVDDAVEVLRRTRASGIDVVVSDLYDGPSTVTSLFTVDGVAALRRVLRADGVLVCNLSDAAPFALSRVVAATVGAGFASQVLLAEPPVLRGRRSGNLVLAASDRELAQEELVRRATAGPVRARVVAGDDLDAFIDAAAPATEQASLPASGESGVRW
jgi:spermidine synthase